MTEASNSLKSYDNLDFLLNIYYDFIYRKESEKNYMFKAISTRNIKLIDLKKPDTFDAKRVIQKTSSLDYEGYWNDRIHYKLKDNTGYPSQLSIGQYESSNSDLIDRGVLYNVAIMYIMSEVVANDVFKHSVLPVMLFDIEYAQLNDLIPNFKKNMAEAGVEYDESKPFYCLITEHFFNMQTLKKFLSDVKDADETFWKTLIFQVLFALYKLGQRLNRFRHNRLNLDAIKVYVKKGETGTSSDTSSYKVGSDMFEIPNVGFDVKINDFDYATTTDYIDNNTTGTAKNPLDNPYYDVHYFLNSLMLWGRDNDISFPTTVETFLRDVVPEELFVDNSKNFEGMNEADESYMNLPSHKSAPALILKNNAFFDEFKIGGLSRQRKIENLNSINSLSEMSVSPLSELEVEIDNIYGGMTSEISDRSSENLTSLTDTDNVRFLAQKVDSTNKKLRDTSILRSLGMAKNSKNLKNSTKSAKTTTGSNIRRGKIFNKSENDSDRLKVIKTKKETETEMSEVSELSEVETDVANTATYERYFNNLSKISARKQHGNENESESSPATSNASPERKSSESERRSSESERRSSERKSSESERRSSERRSSENKSPSEQDVEESPVSPLSEEDPTDTITGSAGYKKYFDAVEMLGKSKSKKSKKSNKDRRHSHE